MIGSIKDICVLASSGETDWSQYGHVYTKEQGDLILFNYTPQAQYENRWNFFERVSRGLIINRKTGEVVARPFDKFFNWGERGRYGKGHIVTVTEKHDGSLGILLRHNGKYKIATRGSFDSEQAIWATTYLHEVWGAGPFIPDRLTLLFEIIYPENRVVVDYEGYAGLVLLAARDRFTGEYEPYYPTLYEYSKVSNFDLVSTWPFHSITDIIEATGKIDANQEGWVVEMSDGSRWKFKGDDYVHLHRLISGLSYKKAVEAVRRGKVDELIEIVPDEFLDEFKEWVEEIQRRVWNITSYIEAIFEIAPKESRKEFAIWVKTYHIGFAPYLFKRYDNKDYIDLIYRREFK
jgi:RNA ligase